MYHAINTPLATGTRILGYFTPEIANLRYPINVVMRNLGYSGILRESR